MSRQKWRKIYFSELQTLHIFHVLSGSVRAKTRGVVKLRKETSGESLNTIILNHFGQALNGESLKEIGRPPSFTSAWFSQTTVHKQKVCQKSYIRFCSVLGGGSGDGGGGSKLTVLKYHYTMQ